MDTSPAQYSALLHAGIPISRALGFKVVTIGAQPYRITASAPIEANINNHGTGFAGSLYSLALLTAWTLVRHYLRCEFPDAQMELVARKAAIRYFRPVVGSIVCQCSLVEDDLPAFKATLEGRRRARISVATVIPVSGGDAPAAVLEVQFVAWPKTEAQAPSPLHARL
eukprot:EG_transcript_23690